MGDNLGMNKRGSESPSYSLEKQYRRIVASLSCNGKKRLLLGKNHVRNLMGMVNPDNFLSF